MHGRKLHVERSWWNIRFYLIKIDALSLFYMYSCHHNNSLKFIVIFVSPHQVVQLVRPIMDIAQSPSLTDEAAMVGRTDNWRTSAHHTQSTDTISLQEGTFCSIHRAEQSSVGCENCCEMFCCNCLNSPTTFCLGNNNFATFVAFISQILTRGT